MFKINEPVVCVDANDVHLTEARTYVVFNVGEDSIRIVNDNGVCNWYPNKRFIPITSYPDGWDYAVADALRKKASDAIDEYNAYVDKQPTTTYYKLHKGY